MVLSEAPGIVVIVIRGRVVSIQRAASIVIIGIATGDGGANSTLALPFRPEQRCHQLGCFWQAIVVCTVNRRTALLKPRGGLGKLCGDMS